MIFRNILNKNVMKKLLMPVEVYLIQVTKTKSEFYSFIQFYLKKKKHGSTGLNYVWHYKVKIMLKLHRLNS